MSSVISWKIDSATENIENETSIRDAGRSWRTTLPELDVGGQTKKEGSFKKTDWRVWATRLTQWIIALLYLNSSLFITTDH